MSVVELLSKADPEAMGQRGYPTGAPFPRQVGPEAMGQRGYPTGVIAPDYVLAHDHVWLRALIDEVRRFAGRPQRELEVQLQEPLPCSSPRAKRNIAEQVLLRLCRDKSRPPRKPRELRAYLFALAAKQPGVSARSVRQAAARDLDLSADVIDEFLFADLPRERRIAPVPEHLSPAALALHVNLAIVQSVLRRSLDVTLELCGNARAVVRAARSRGLICVVHSATAEAADGSADGRSGPRRTQRRIPTYSLELSGPMSLFRRTAVYGRALAGIVPQLGWCDRYRLEAHLAADDAIVPVRVCSGDPILPAQEPPRYDSQLEKRFARDFACVAPDWDLIREPEPLDTGHGLIFPDFALEHRRDRARRWHLEIVGFWTPEYLQKKLRDLRAISHPRLILCVDEARACGADEFPKQAAVVTFRRRIDTSRILQIVEEH